jgi:hypothetical protein
MGSESHIVDIEPVAPDKAAWLEDSINKRKTTYIRREQGVVDAESGSGEKLSSTESLNTVARFGRHAR